jgi:hypothetical protein
MRGLEKMLNASRRNRTAWHGYMTSVTPHWVKWEAFVNTITKLRVPENYANFLITWGEIWDILGCGRDEVVVEVFAVVDYCTGWGMSVNTPSPVRTTSRSWDKGVLTDLCLTLYFNLPVEDSLQAFIHMYAIRRHSRRL